MAATKTSEVRVKEAIDEDWFESLLRELHQVEQSARRHPAVEAERLGERPPGRAMAAIAAHGEEMRARLTALTRPIDPELQHAGDAAGNLLSLLRRTVVDRPISIERSYRATLLGVTHGVDLARLIRPLAEAHGHPELSAFCREYLDSRVPLLEVARTQLAWFAAHPEVAARPVGSGPGARFGRWLIAGYERIQAVLDRAEDDK